MPRLFLPLALIVASIPFLAGCPPFMRPGAAACARGPRYVATASP